MRETRTCLEKYEWKEVKLVSLLRNISTNKSLRVLRSTEKKCHRGTTNAPLTSSRKLINGKVHVTSLFFPCKARADQMRIIENNTKRTKSERMQSKRTSSLASLSALALVHPPVSRPPFRTPSPRIGRRRRRFRPWTRFLSARRLLSKKKKKQIASTWRRA